MNDLVGKCRSIAVLVCVLTGLAACGTGPSLGYRVAQPAANMEAARLTHVAVMGFGGWHGEGFARQLDRELRAVSFDGAPWFEVAHGGDAGRFSNWSGIGPSANEAIDYGRRNGLDGVWYGYADADSEMSGVYYDTRSRCVEWDGLFDCETREEYEVECYKVQADANVKVLLMDVAAGRVVYNRTLSDDDKEKFCADEYGFWEFGEEPYGWGLGDSSGVERDMIAGLARKVRSDVAPTIVRGYAPLMDKPATPYADLVYGFEKATRDALDGRSAAACRRYTELSESYRADAALIFNLAACAEMEGDFVRAESLYLKAMEYGEGSHVAARIQEMAGTSIGRLSERLQTREMINDLIEATGH